MKFLNILDNGKRLNSEEIVDLLNEQQSTINELKEENDKLIQKNCIPCELVNSQTREIDKLKEENEQLLRYKYFVKAVEVFTDCPISETIADYSDGELFDEEEQLEFGKKMLEQEKRVG